MRRMISLVMVATLLSVTSLPLLPQAAICHALENRADCDTCHLQEVHAGSDMHAISEHSIHAPGMEMPHGMTHNHDMHSSMMHHESTHAGHDKQLHDQRNSEQAKGLHKHHKQLSAAERECRIECGCGCNRSLDGFPQVLSPHITPSIEFKTGERTVRIQPEAFPALHTLERDIPPPPPKQL